LAKHIIVLHGRSIKPAEAKMKVLVKRAVVEGLKRIGENDIAGKVGSSSLKISSAYYGDINNAIQQEHDDDDAAVMTAKDPDHDNGPALPHGLIEDAMELTLANSPKFTKARYNKVLGEAEDTRFYDEAVSVISFLGAVATFGSLNEKVIEWGKPDMGQYLMSHTVASQIRSRLESILEPSIMAGNEILLITHSMGCMVAYDVFWKFSQRSQFQKLRNKQNPVSKWITIGCPLGEPGVRKNLIDGKLHIESEKHPKNMFKDWKNFWAEDDYIAHRTSMKKAFGKFRKKMGVDNIKDRQIYNCWTYEKGSEKRLISNPHDLYGYLLERHVSQDIADWAKN